MNKTTPKEFIADILTLLFFFFKVCYFAITLPLAIVSYFYKKQKLNQMIQKLEPILEKLNFTRIRIIHRVVSNSSEYTISFDNCHLTSYHVPKNGQRYFRMSKSNEVKQYLIQENLKVIDLEQNCLMINNILKDYESVISPLFVEFQYADERYEYSSIINKLHTERTDFNLFTQCWKNMVKFPKVKNAMKNFIKANKVMLRLVHSVF